jgi:hypothetical protein
MLAKLLERWLSSLLAMKARAAFVVQPIAPQMPIATLQLRR